MADAGAQSDTRMERNIKVRQVTDIQASWTEKARGGAGVFTVQLILDKGVEEYLLEVSPDDLEPMLRLFAASDHATFDLERKVLMFGALKVK